MSNALVSKFGGTAPEDGTLRFRLDLARTLVVHPDRLELQGPVHQDRLVWDEGWHSEGPSGRTAQPELFDNKRLLRDLLYQLTVDPPMHGQLVEAVLDQLADRWLDQNHVPMGLEGPEVSRTSVAPLMTGLLVAAVYFAWLVFVVSGTLLVHGVSGGGWGLSLPLFIGAIAALVPLVPAVLFVSQRTTSAELAVRGQTVKWERRWMTGAENWAIDFGELARVVAFDRTLAFESRWGARHHAELPQHSPATVAALARSFRGHLKRSGFGDDGDVPDAIRNLKQPVKNAT